jgi:hypothetical protein
MHLHAYTHIYILTPQDDAPRARFPPGIPAMHASITLLVKVLGSSTFTVGLNQQEKQVHVWSVNALCRRLITMHTYTFTVSLNQQDKQAHVCFTNTCSRGIYIYIYTHKHVHTYMHICLWSV